MGFPATVGAACFALAYCVIQVAIRAKNFGATPVLGTIAFDVVAGETVALVGPSGIGKTTLLRIVAGIDTDFDGDIQRPDSQAIVFQEPTLLPWRSVLDNLLLVHRGLARNLALEALDRVGLTGKDKLFPGQLSLGQQRRLSLARAFAGKPQMLILDEPFVSLDPASADRMMALTERLIREQKPATIFVTHSEKEASRLADRKLQLIASPDGALLE